MALPQRAKIWPQFF